jgi:hypothetical protein
LVKINTELEQYKKETDDCYYLLAYSEYYIGNKGNVRKYVELLTQKYPDSGYINYANGLLELIEK